MYICFKTQNHFQQQAAFELIYLIHLLAMMLDFVLRFFFRLSSHSRFDSENL